MAKGLTMNDYEPLDLFPYCNAGLSLVVDDARGRPSQQVFHKLSLFGDAAPEVIGQQTFHGLPFWIGGPDATDECCYLAFGSGLRTKSIKLPLEKKARHIIVAHCLLDSGILQGGPVGEPVADYVFHLGGDKVSRISIRERFEISTVPSIGDPPFLAIPDQKAGLYPRNEGPWGEGGRRQTEAWAGSSRRFLLWVWENPNPERTIEALEIIPKNLRFFIGGITLGHLDEYPFPRETPQEVVITLPRLEEASKPFNLDVDVDRGHASYPYALPQQSVEAFLKDGWKGWGEQQNPSSSPVYVEVSAIPSAKLSVKQNGEEFGEVKWGELQEKGRLEPTPKLTVQVIQRGRNWVHTRVLDDETGKPVPCRVHFRSPEGIPYAPHGHHAHVNSNLESFNFDVGGDLRLGQISYAYIDGTCQGWLPRGNVIVDVARGFEYEPLRTTVIIQPGQRELELRLKRWRNMNEKRWFSGDPHVHFLSIQGGHTEARGEGLNVVSVLQSQWGNLFTNTEEFTGRPSVSPDGQTIIYVSQENRQHCLGHLTLLGLKKPVMPWSSDGLNEAEIGGALEVTLSHWADQCHSQGGTVIVPHFPVPNGEPAVLIATGRADAVEMTRHYTQRRQDKEYYRYLNGGYKLPLAGGSDKMSSDIPVGIYRTYVHIPPEEPFTYENWCKNLASGRTFVSGGPILRFTVDGHRIGDSLTLPGNGGTVEVVAEAESIFPIHTLEVVQEGQVIASTEERKGSRKLSLRAKVKVDGHSWLAARCSGVNIAQDMEQYDAWGRGISAHTSPIYLVCGESWWMANRETARYMLTIIEGSIAYIRHTSRHYRLGEVTHHHGEENHLAYLERPFHEAMKEIHHRMQKMERLD